MGEKCIQHNPAIEHPVDTPDFGKIAIGNLAQRLKEITDNPELAPEQKRTAFWKNFNTLTDYPPGLDNRLYWLMDIQKLLIGAARLKELLREGADEATPKHPTPEALENDAALMFEHCRSSFDGIAPNSPDNPQLPSSRVFEKAWHAAKESQPKLTESANICITPALLEITDGKDASSFIKLWLQESSRLSDIQTAFDCAHQQINRGQKAAFLSVVGERIAEILINSKTTLFTAFLRLRAAQITHDLAKLGYYGQEVENISQRKAAMTELTELATSLKNDTRYNIEKPGIAKTLYEQAMYFHSLYRKEQEALENTPPANPADHLGAVAVSDTTTTLQHAA